jgi:hypothetical protein
MAADVTLDETYKVRKANVFMSLRIGDGQFGTSDVFLDDQQILRVSGPIGKLLIGKGEDLVGSMLLIRSIVNDVSAATNRMSVGYQLRGGAATREFIARGKVDKPGALLVFEATFEFVQA